MIPDFFHFWQQYQSLVKIPVSQGQSTSFGMSFWYVQKLYVITLFQCFARELYYKMHAIYYIYDARMLTWCTSVSIIENQHSQWWRTTLLLPPLHLCGGHGEHPPCLQWLSRHHSADAPAAVRALVMDSSRTCSALLPAYLALPYRKMPQSSRRQENDHLTQAPGPPPTFSVSN